MKDFTPSQKKALDDKRHLAITANAGSGKTSVLVERYVRLFENHDSLRPRNVLAITYTDAAAAELRVRIAKAIADRLMDPALDRIKRKRLERLRDGLSNAYISTIHAFARRIILAYPVEANVDATFVTLPPEDQTLMIEEEIAATFRDVLQASYDRNDDADPMLSTFRLLGRREVSELVSELINRRTRANNLQKLLKNSDDAIIDQWRRAIEEEIEKRLQEFSRLFESLVSAIPKADKRTQVEQKFEAALRASTFQQRCATFSELYTFVFTGDDTVRNAFIPKKEIDAGTVQLADELSGLYKPIAKLLTLMGASDFADSHREYLSHLRNVVTLYDMVNIQYTESKAEYGLLDFDDQVDRLYDLVHQEEIANELSKQFQYILIDEYQDTDAQQYEIARRLTGDFRAGNKLAIVGDPKQSIYAFRNADVTVFDQTRAAIEAQTLSVEAEAEARNLGMTNLESSGAITLAESFRTADRPLAYVNHIFRELMRADSLTNSATEYVALTAARPGRVTGSVEWLLAPPDPRAAVTGDAESEEDEPSGGHGEAELLAKKILQIVKERKTEYQIYDSKENESVGRDPKFEDIVILLRNRKLVPTLEEALTKFRIPYVVSRGTGFFDQQEIVDLISYFKFLLNPKDDVALIGILRSPLFALSDTLLFTLYADTEPASPAPVAATERSSFWDRVRAFAAANPAAEFVLARACSTLEENLKLAGRVDCSVLLEKILDESGIAATYSAHPAGKQILANINKFVQIARGHDTRDLSTLYDFVVRMDDLVESRSEEAQAQTSTGDTVRIMTIHGAKGLEFPIVFVAGLALDYNKSNKHLLDARFGILFSKKELQKPAVSALMELLQAQQQSREEKRVLYVACTRAKDHLILSGKRPSTNKKSNPLWEFNALHNGKLYEADASELGLVETIARYDPALGESRQELLTFSIPLIRAIDAQVETSSSSEFKSKELPPLHLESYPSAAALRRFSPSQLLTQMECPTKYYLRYILGLPEDSRLVFDLPPDELAERIHNEFAEPQQTSDASKPQTASTGGPMLGQIIHKLFERVDQLHKKGAVDADEFNHQFEAIAASMGVKEASEIRKFASRARNDLDLFVRSDIGTTLFAARESKTEFSIQAALSPKDHLRGIIDRFYFDHENEARILDYKTDHITGRENPKKKARYEFQVSFYAYLISRLYPEKEKIVATLYYTRNGEVEEYTFDKESFQRVEQQVLERIEEVRSLEKIKNLAELTRNRDHCRECAYFEKQAGLCVADVGTN